MTAENHISRFVATSFLCSIYLCLLHFSFIRFTHTTWLLRDGFSSQVLKMGPFRIILGVCSGGPYSWTRVTGLLVRAVLADLSRCSLRLYQVDPRDFNTDLKSHHVLFQQLFIAEHITSPNLTVPRWPKISGTTTALIKAARENNASFRTKALSGNFALKPASVVFDGSLSLNLTVSCPNHLASWWGQFLEAVDARPSRAGPISASAIDICLKADSKSLGIPVFDVLEMGASSCQGYL